MVAFWLVVLLSTVLECLKGSRAHGSSDLYKCRILLWDVTRVLTQSRRHGHMWLLCDVSCCPLMFRCKLPLAIRARDDLGRRHFENHEDWGPPATPTRLSTTSQIQKGLQRNSPGRFRLSIKPFCFLRPNYRCPQIDEGLLCHRP